MEPRDKGGIPDVEEIRNGNNLLIDAVRGGNQEIIEQILQAGVDINEPQSSGATPIVESKNGTVAKFLIDRGADVNHATNRTMRTPLMYVVQRLSNQVWTCRNDDCIKEVILVLVENGADVNARTSNGRTPLMLAATVSGQAEILKMLLDHGADCTARDNIGNTALLHAAIADCSDNAIFLIQFMENNTDQLNVQNNSGSTALMYSVFRGSWNIASMLIDKGADVNTTDLNGDTALILAISSLPEEDYLEHLIRAGCNVNHQNNAGLSPLMLAVRRCKYTDTVPLLLASGADVNAVNHTDTSKTALSYLINNHEWKAITCLEAFLDNGADACYLSPCFLGTIISNSSYKLIPKLIRCGLAPFDYNIDDLPFGLKYRVGQEGLTLPPVSPMCVAVLAGDVTLARYFWENLFLTNMDLSLASNNDVRLFCQTLRYEECLSFLDEIGSQPMSLEKICLVVVSSDVGASPGRKARVNELSLPCQLKDALLFKSEVLAQPEVVNLAQPEVVNLAQPEDEYAEDEYREDEYPEDEYPEDEYSEDEHPEDEYPEDEYPEYDYPVDPYSD